MTNHQTARERIPVEIYENAQDASITVAFRIARLIKENNAAQKNTVLGLATGHTPVNVYRELIRQHRQQQLDLSRVVTFNLDEYWPIDPATTQSYHAWMHENFFNHVNIKPENIHIPRGDIPEDQIPAFCRQYEQLIVQAGGLDLQILGIGRSGHIGFNEPGSAKTSRTRRVKLDTITRKDAASDFFGEENVPENAITMGVGSILPAKQICLLAFGEHKADILQQAVEGPVTASVAASFLQQHQNTTFFVDEAAAANLTRIQTPWLLGPCQWDDILRQRAVIWLAQRLQKPILKLTHEDYTENDLSEILTPEQDAYQVSLDVFRRQMNTITSQPAEHEPRRILIFSPHPDDDVISMGGTMTLLAQQGHEVHVAYMVSGYLSVFDHDVARYVDFAREFNRIFELTPEQSNAIEEHLDRFFRDKKAGAPDTPQIQDLKGLIRQAEAIAAAKHCGIKEENLHFLNLPFYNTGKVQKLTLSPQDITIVSDLLQTVQPQMIFAAGDLSDPHGTHRLCLEAILHAYHQTPKTIEQPELWLYRGAWQEWLPWQIDRAVPLSDAVIKRKRYAIFRHESQKDRAMFPGPYDTREFWQRAEERNMATAHLYDELGLPELPAIEAFARYPLARAINTTAQIQKPPTD